MYGPIPRVWGKGTAAKQVWDLVTRLQREKNNAEEPKTNQQSCIDMIILIDRSVDLITPLATQLTYEGNSLGCLLLNIINLIRYICTYKF